MHDTQNALHRNPLNRQHSNNRYDDDDSNNEKRNNRKKILTLKKFREEERTRVDEEVHQFLMIRISSACTIILITSKDEWDESIFMWLVRYNFNANQGKERETAKKNGMAKNRSRKELKSIKFELLSVSLPLSLDVVSHNV